MRITIHDDGRVEPADAAALLLTEYLQELSGDVERDPSIRTFVCSGCGENIEAVAGKTMVHVCTKGDISHWTPGQDPN